MCFLRYCVYLNCSVFLLILRLLLRRSRRDKCAIIVELVILLSDHEAGIAMSWILIHSFFLLFAAHNIIRILVLPIRHFRYKFKVILIFLTPTNIEWDLSTNVVIIDINIVCFGWILEWICLHHSFILSFCNVQLEALVDVLDICDFFEEIIDEVLFFLGSCIEHIHLLTRARVMIMISWNSTALNLHPLNICTLPSFIWPRLLVKNVVLGEWGSEQDRLAPSIL